jgi:predicted nucleic acid-binding Zn ribbon protein
VSDSLGAALAALRRRDVPHTCPVCGVEFKGFAKAKFCSNTCKQRMKNMNAIATRAYIISSGSVIAEITTALPSGRAVRWSRQRCAEAIDANREWNLVNARSGKISRAQKWARLVSDDAAETSAVEINPGEFYLT